MAIGLIASVAILAVLLQTTKPASAGPLGILVVFILMYVSMLCALTFFMYGISRLIVKVATPVTVRRPLQAISLRQSYYYSSVIALAPVMIIGMQSVGEVGLYDVMLVMIFVVIACVYIAKRTN